MPRADGARLFAMMRIVLADLARQIHLISLFAGTSGPADYFFSAHKFEDMTEPRT